MCTEIFWNMKFVWTECFFVVEGGKYLFFLYIHIYPWGQGFNIRGHYHQFSWCNSWWAYEWLLFQKMIISKTHQHKRKQKQHCMHVSSTEAHATHFSLFLSSCWCVNEHIREVVTCDNGAVLPSADAMWQFRFPLCCLYMRACTNRDCSTLPNKQHDVSLCSHKVTQPWITQWNGTLWTDNSKTCALRCGHQSCRTGAFLSKQLVNCIHLPFQVYISAWSESQNTR